MKNMLYVGNEYPALTETLEDMFSKRYPMFSLECSYNALDAILALEKQQEHPSMALVMDEVCPGRITELVETTYSQHLKRPDYGAISIHLIATLRESYPNMPLVAIIRPDHNRISRNYMQAGASSVFEFRTPPNRLSPEYLQDLFSHTESYLGS